MDHGDEPQLPLTPRKKAMLAVGGLMFVVQVLAAFALAPATTGSGNADAGLLALIWCGCVLWSVPATLLIVRQADLPDIATSAFIVTLSAFAAFALSGAFHVRGTSEEVDLVDTLFLGVTTGALTALLVWGIAMGAARLLRLPTTEALRAK
jgi:hypothetical protein